jgi:hypothetical protein
VKKKLKQAKDGTFKIAALFFEKGSNLMDLMSDILKGERVIKLSLERKSNEKGGNDNE